MQKDPLRKVLEYIWPELTDVLKEQPFEDYNVVPLKDGEYNKIINAQDEMDKIGRVWDILFPKFQPRLYETF